MSRRALWMGAMLGAAVPFLLFASAVIFGRPFGTPLEIVFWPSSLLLMSERIGATEGAAMFGLSVALDSLLYACLFVGVARLNRLIRGRSHREA